MNGGGNGHKKHSSFNGRKKYKKNKKILGKGKLDFLEPQKAFDFAQARGTRVTKSMALSMAAKSLRLRSGRRDKKNKKILGKGKL